MYSLKFNMKVIYKKDFKIILEIKYEQKYCIFSPLKILKKKEMRAATHLGRGGSQG